MSAKQVSEAVEYRPIPGFPGYRVGSDGTVWTCKIQGGSNRKWILSDQWRRLSPAFDCGYLKIGIYRDGRFYGRKVHSVVLEAFVGPRPPGKMACHYNGIRNDNRIENLRWDTAKSNGLDSIRHGTATRGSKSAVSVLTETDVRQIISLHKSGMSQGRIARAFGVNQGSISCILSGRTWNHVSRIKNA